MNINITKNGVFKAVVIVLLVVILGLLLWSQPWSSSSATTKTISVTGEATIESEPDQYVFMPYYEATGTDQVAVQEELTVKANEVTAKLKELGVEDKSITLQSSAYSGWYPDETGKSTTSVSLEIKITNKDQIQKIQDYLATTGAKGQITPQSDFSEAKKKELDKQATDKASEDARAKAEAQAKVFGATVGDVVKIEQGSSVGIGYPQPLMATADLAEGSARDSATTASSLPVLVGQNSYSASVSVTYELQ